MSDVEHGGPACREHGVEVSAIGVTDDIYTVDVVAGTVELHNDMSDDQRLIRVRCVGCNATHEVETDEWEDDDTLPKWVRQALELAREEGL